MARKTMHVESGENTLTLKCGGVTLGKLRISYAGETLYVKPLRGSLREVGVRLE